MPTNEIAVMVISALKHFDESRPPAGGLPGAAAKPPDMCELCVSSSCSEFTEWRVVLSVEVLSTQEMIAVAEPLHCERARRAQRRPKRERKAAGGEQPVRI